MTHCHTVIASLRQRGYRITPQRELIIEALLHNPDHITAEALHTRVQAHTRAINIATIYRTLDMLVDEGLASRTDLHGGQMSYAPEIHGPHLHLTCRRCRQTMDIGDELIASVGQELRQKFGFQADLRHLTLEGICQGCLPGGTSLKHHPDQKE